MLPTNTDPDIALSSVFAEDVLNGLSSTPKMLSSKYFYDAKGDELFQQIMHMPEYYLTNCELEIFERQKAAILSAIGHQAFNLIELGAGDGYKTKILLKHFLEKQVQFEYQPIDISENVLNHLEKSLHLAWPDLQVRPLAGDYFEVLHQMQGHVSVPKVILFLGANIGNYEPAAAATFLQHLREELDPGDFLLIGLDLKKDPDVILNAYNDPAGITAAFNLNLLERMNRELGANFEISQFRHWETYNPLTGATRSYILSEKDQHVFIKALNRSFHFEAWEAISVELSQKYSLSEVHKLADDAGFQLIQHFTDSRDYFVDSLWRVPG
jgi:L-histidine N-alpha-methyltransferase